MPVRIGTGTVASETKPLVPESQWSEGSTDVSKSKQILVNERAVIFSHQIVSESLHNSPNVPILQPLPNLHVVVFRSAANLSRSQRSGGVAHGQCGGDGGGLWLSLNITSQTTNMSCVPNADYVLILSHSGEIRITPNVKCERFDPTRSYI
jgi:hypothetical protein